MQHDPMIHGVSDVSCSWPVVDDVYICLWHVKSLKTVVFRNPSGTLPDLAFSVWFIAVSMKVLTLAPQVRSFPFIPGERCFNCAIDFKVRRALYSLIYTLLRCTSIQLTVTTHQRFGEHGASFPEFSSNASFEVSIQADSKHSLVE